jgi:hypothetical protein
VKNRIFEFYLQTWYFGTHVSKFSIESIAEIKHLENSFYRFYHMSFVQVLSNLFIDPHRSHPEFSNL